jgi:hypothetical protein
MTKTAALKEFRAYMHDVRIAARKDGFSAMSSDYWPMFVERWLEDGKITNETANKWFRTGPR